MNKDQLIKKAVTEWNASADKYNQWDDLSFTEKLECVASTVLSQPVQPAIERNFCGRCGKRLSDSEYIHTCTPPLQRRGEKS